MTFEEYTRHIDWSLTVGRRDTRRMLEGVKLARKIGGNLALAQFELEIMPGAAVEVEPECDSLVRAADALSAFVMHCFLCRLSTDTG